MSTSMDADKAGAAMAARNARALNRERETARFLARLHARQADPLALGVLIPTIYGAALLCVFAALSTVLAKVLGVRHV